MTPDTIMMIGSRALEITLALAAPLLLAALITGVIIGAFQAATSINEMTLSFIPKLLAIATTLDPAPMPRPRRSSEARNTRLIEVPMSASQAEIRPAELNQLIEDGAPGAKSDVNLEVILDVPVTLSMEVGRTRIPIRNLLQLNQGSVVELERAAGEPLDVFVNGTLVAHGEVVVVNERFGIRLTDVISPAERLRKLK